ncbi:MAG: hypothetical protein U0840_20820 [Gemmataceae bacterium]
METASVHAEGEREALRYKWIESEKAGFDLGEAALRRWVRQHWCGFLRARWLEHIRGVQFWVELDQGDFGLLLRRFQDDAPLLDRILDRLVEGRDNLDIICWAIDWGMPMPRVMEILESLDINSRRLINGIDGPVRNDVPLVKVDPAWLAWEGGIVPRLARGIAADGDFGSLPVLGDALEEAGCADPVILGHCRSAKGDIPWSWLVDLLLWAA